MSRYVKFEFGFKKIQPTWLNFSSHIGNTSRVLVLRLAQKILIFVITYDICKVPRCCLKYLSTWPCNFENAFMSYKLQQEVEILHCVLMSIETENKKTLRCSHVQGYFMEKFSQLHLLKTWMKQQQLWVWFFEI